MAEALTRASGLWRAGLFTEAEFNQFDQLHYEVENKLLALISSLEAKRNTGQWVTTLPTYLARQPTQQSINPTIH